MNLSLLEKWVPLRLLSSASGPIVDWAYLGDERFTDPFFEQTIAHCMHHPASVLFRHRTPMETLQHLYKERRGIAPTGFIFHMSRCGSTLVAQMLATIERNIVISEARPIDQVLRAAVDEECRVEWLRWIVNALAQRRQPDEEYFFMKVDAWHVLHLPLIQRAFPNTPWVFLYRDPIEVLVSQQRERGVQVVPGALSPALFGLDPCEPWISRLDEYAARVVARLCDAALEQRGHGRNLLINFSELPGVVSGTLLKFFGAQYTDDEIARLREVAAFDAKRPGLPYENDSVAKQRAASEELRRLCDRIVRPCYERLEAARLAQSITPAPLRAVPGESSRASSR
jgi:hypothetical protein